jgi:hypothetical protein
MYMQFMNRIGGILAWVGLWNLIILWVNETDVVGNILLFILGVDIWWLTNEFS